jgi:DNA-binding transcriptional regulator YiaG
MAKPSGGCLGVVEENEKDARALSKHDPSSPHRVFARLRDAAGLSQPDWGRRLGVAESTISRWEMGVRAPSRAQALAILLAMRDMPGNNRDDLRLVAIGWGVDPATIGIEEVDDEPVVAAPAPAPHEAKAPAVDARRIVDGALLAASEDTDLSVRVVRRVCATLLAALEAGEVTVAAARAALVK